MGGNESKSIQSEDSGYPNANMLKGANESDALLNKNQNHGENSVNDAGSRGGKLTILTGVVFIVGEMAGSGVLALPKAIENTGWIGLILVITSCIALGWCGVLLGRSWLILEERYPQYQDHCRNPYPSIGYECFGKPGRILVSVCIDITLFGVPVVFLILAAQNLHEIFSAVPALHFSSCLWMLILAAIVIPFVWLGTPKDFWPIAVGATLATALACIMLIADISTHPVNADPSKVKHNDIDVKTFALAFGTILFSFGGASTFPTIQHDMKNRSDFPKSVALGFMVLFLMYFPVPLVGYLLLGNALEDNILVGLGKNGGKNWMYYTVQALIVAHLLPALVIAINPLCQDIEQLLKLPLRFTWKRAVCRTIIMLAVLFVAETIPNFGPILSLIGGSTITLLAIVLPCIFYLKLCSIENPGWPERKAQLHEWIFSIEIIIVGLVGGVITIYSAVSALANPATFLPPCYVNLTVDSS